MLRVGHFRQNRRYWPKASSVFVYKTTQPIDVGFSGENLNPNSVNYLEQNFEQQKTYKTAVKQLDQRREHDMNMPIRVDRLHPDREVAQRTFDRLHDDLCKQGCHERCALCNVPISWKNTQLLSQFISPWSGRIYERGVTNLCDKAYWKVKDEILRAQDNGLLGRNYRPTEFNVDPNLSAFDYNGQMHTYKGSRNARKAKHALRPSAYGKSDIDQHLDKLRELEYDTPGRYDDVMSEETKNDKKQKNQEFFFSLTPSGDNMEKGYFKAKRAKQHAERFQADLGISKQEYADVNERPGEEK